jgi:hypothetical protein
MDFQIPLMAIDRRGVSVMSGVIPNRRVARLRDLTLRDDSESMEV